MTIIMQENVEHGVFQAPPSLDLNYISYFFPKSKCICSCNKVISKFQYIHEQFLM